MVIMQTLQNRQMVIMQNSQMVIMQNLQMVIMQNLQMVIMQNLQMVIMQTLQIMQVLKNLQMNRQQKLLQEVGVVEPPADVTDPPVLNDAHVVPPVPRHKMLSVPRIGTHGKCLWKSVYR